LQNDFTHPSPAGGVVKVASQLLAFFKTDATATPWFLRNVATGQPPVLTANANVTTGNVPLNVSFSAAATDPDGTIVTYQWTFGDGTFSRTQDAAKVFRAPGTYEVRVTATDNSGNTAQQTIPVTVKLSLPEWRPIYFTAAELQDPEISGDAADPDRDAATNLAEYALGSHPKIADLPVFAARASGGQLILTYPQAKYAADVTIAVEVSSGPSGPWQSGPNATSQQVVGDDGIVQTVEATDLATASARRFMRLRIDRIPAPRSR
jgi:PKD repeat protein